MRFCVTPIGPQGQHTEDHLVKSKFIACHECDLLHHVRVIPDGGSARCIRCAALLYRRKDNSIDQVLALTITGLILFALANAFPMLTMRLDANFQETTLLTGVFQLWKQGLPGLAVLVLLTSVLLPLLKLLLLAYILLPLRLGMVPPATGPVFRLVLALQPWAMMEVFLLGVLVAMVKLSSTAEIIVGLAMYAFGFLILVLAGITASLDPNTVWERLEVR
ncbi:MAG: paraquat-inducible protein A [Proteobacteria bacterium]|nr:paraquat-inducible protein A [Pseudomonadota bacterium]